MVCVCKPDRILITRLPETGDSLIRWTGELETGMADGDEQHCHLVDLTNSRYKAMPVISIKVDEEND